MTNLPHFPPDPSDFLPQPPWKGPPLPVPRARVLYHSTSPESLLSIKQTGLIPSPFHGDRPIRPGVYLATTPFWACMYGGDVLLEVTVPDVSLLKKPSWANEHERLYYGIIGPKFIKVSKRTCNEVLEES